MLVSGDEFATHADLEIRRKSEMPLNVMNRTFHETPNPLNVRKFTLSRS